MTQHTAPTATPDGEADDLALARHWVGVAEGAYTTATDESGFVKASAAARIAMVHVALTDVTPTVMVVDAFRDRA